MIATRQDLSQSYLVYTRNINTGRISRVTIPTNTSLLGSLCLNVGMYTCNSSNITTIQDEHTVALIQPDTTTLSGTRVYVALPTTPSVGQVVVVKDAFGTAAINNIEIIGPTQTSIIEFAFESITFCYDDRSKSWHVIAPSTPQLRGSGAQVDADETLGTTGSYIDLATPGPTCSAVVGSSQQAIVTISAVSSLIDPPPTGIAWISVATSGASTVAATDTNSTKVSAVGNSEFYSMSRTMLLTGLTSGTNVFTMKYKGDHSSWKFCQRALTALAL